ncbi:MAG: division/cell wall cluster transcriptional repressor MraZ [Ignavibacteriae bacterium]|nr:division/cell wall cluster transcriptional repressor MraZ [Ignavibacteriota bacterium]
MVKFRGTYESTLDEKGRFVFPKKLRQNLAATADRFIIIPGHEKCLYLHPLDNWEKKEQEYEALNEHNAEHRLLIRILQEGLEEVSLDSQYRIMIPSKHIEYAQLSLRSTIRVSGAFDKIEIWDPAVYEEYKSKPENARSFGDISAAILGGTTL